MFKLVVLFALIAAAVCEPKPSSSFLGGAYYSGAAPYAYASPYLAPAAASYYNYNAQPYFYSSPYAYSAPAHFIKKRSAAFAYAPTYYPNTYLASAPLATSYSYGSSASLIHSAPILPATSLYTAPAHFIKKRSASLALPSTYIAPSNYAYGPASPVLPTSFSYGATPYYTSPYYASPYYASGPFAYSTFIKK